MISNERSLLKEACSLRQQTFRGCAVIQVLKELIMPLAAIWGKGGEQKS